MLIPDPSLFQKVKCESHLGDFFCRIYLQSNLAKYDFDEYDVLVRYQNMLILL